MDAATHTRTNLLERFVLGLVFVTQAAFFPWFPKLQSPNELTRVYLAEAMTRDGDLHIDRPLRRHGAILDLATRVEADGRHFYSDKAPGLTALALPAMALYQATLDDAPRLPPPVEADHLATRIRILRFFGATLPTLLLLVLLMRTLVAELADRRLASVLVLGYGLGTPAVAYAGLAFGHQLSALLLFSLFLLIRRLRPDSPLGRSVAVGLLASFAVAVEYQNALLLLPFAVWYLRRVRLSIWHIAAAVGGLVPITAALLAYHQAAFGSPFLTGYSFLASEFAKIHSQGLLGIGLPNLGHAWLSLLSPAKGLFFFAPWLVLAIPGFILYTRRPDDRFACGFVILYVLFVSAMIYPDGGWTVSQRHLTPVLPFLLLPIGRLIEGLRHPTLSARGGLRESLAGPVLVGLLIPSILVCTLSAITWPHWQEGLQNPFWQIGLRLFSDGWVPPSALSFMASWWLAVILLSAAALVLLAWLVEGELLRLRMAHLTFALAATATIAGAYIALARLPGRDAETHPHRRFIEDVYVPDPRSD
jgi:hypothetical protein